MLDMLNPKKKLNAAIRETLEETKIELDVASVKFLKHGTAHGGGIFYDYIAEIEEEIEPVIDEEHSDWGYFSIDDLPSPITKELHNDVLSVLSNDKTE